MTAFTSDTHPLNVSFVDVPAAGKLGMTFAPGKFQPNAQSGAWDRDLATDLRRLRSTYAVDLLVSVIETHELHELRVAGLGAAAIDLGIEWLHVPVRDACVPEDDTPWLSAMGTVRAALSAAQTVVVHCKGGLGRTGTFAACVLTTYGLEPEIAIAAVREARSKTLENHQQEAYVTHARDAWREYARDQREMSDSSPDQP